MTFTRNEVRGTHLVFSKEEILRFHIWYFESGKSLLRFITLVTTFEIDFSSFSGLLDFQNFIILLNFEILFLEALLLSEMRRFARFKRIRPKINWSEAVDQA